MNVEITMSGPASMNDMDCSKEGSVPTCPDCALCPCHIGHAFTEELRSRLYGGAEIVALDDRPRRATASALRPLNERVAMAGRLGDQVCGGHSGARSCANPESIRLRGYGFRARPQTVGAPE
jgi:hypothetical protein